jgi:LysM repeat protein
MVRVIVGRAARPTTMAVTTEAGKRYSLYMTAVEFEHAEVAKYGAVDREGLKPITSMTGPGLRRLSFSHRIGSLDYKASIEHAIIPLTRLARDGQRVRFVGGSSQYEQGVWWRILDLPVKVEQRAANNHISRATLTWTLEEAGILPPNLTRSIPKPKPAAPVVKKAAAVRTHRVVRGDTLWDLAAKYLRNPLRWPEIYTLNKSVIKNPHWIFPGRVFKIPVS